MKQYIVDAFTHEIFQGNPAAVCVLDKWLDKDLMLKITKENNLSETAFMVKEGEKYHLRWFTPGGEIDLCGHATLASGFVLLNYYEKEAEKIIFTSLSGDLIVEKKGDLYEMEFPSYDLKEVEVTNLMEEATGARPLAAYLGRDLLCIYEDQDFVRNMNPDMEKLLELDGLLLHASARGKDFDSVSRSFAPKLKIKEDPVCGSGHCHIVPYWANKLGKKDILAYQASERGGTLHCRFEGDRVFLAGGAALFAISELMI